MIWELKLFLLLGVLTFCVVVVLPVGLSAVALSLTLVVVSLLSMTFTYPVWTSSCCLWISHCHL